MGLILNLLGAVQEVRSSRTNKEKVESAYRLVEEFFKTSTILLYTRYITRSKEKHLPVTEEIRTLINQYFGEPTFDSWMRLEKLCLEGLSGDRFAEEYKKIIFREIQDGLATKSKNILKEIHRLRSSSYDPPRRITIETFLGSIRLLRNYRSHEWDTNLDLQGLIDLGLDEICISLVDHIFSEIRIQIIKPLALTEKGIETVMLVGLQKHFETFQTSITPDLGKVFITYYEDEQPFGYESNLVRFDIDNNRCYLYLKWRKPNAVFESIAVIEGISKQNQKCPNHQELFGVSPLSDSPEPHTTPITVPRTIRDTLEVTRKSESAPLHLTARMAWHDNKWDGKICSDPEKNWYCTANRSLLSERIAREKKTDIEMQHRGKRIDAIDGYIPPCYWSINAFSSSQYEIIHRNPINEKKEIRETLEKYSIFTWPFRLSFNHDKEKKDLWGQYPPDLEKRIKNFVNKFKMGRSIVFFYLNYDNPVLFEEENKYVLVGCALMTDIKEPLQFNFTEGELKSYRSQLWGRYFPTINWAFQVSYDFEKNGIMLPYHAYVEESKRNRFGEQLLREMRVLIEEDPLIFGFKYVAADIDSDVCIYLLTKLKKSIEIIKKHGIVRIGEESVVIDRLLKKAWQERGLYPSLGSLIDILAEEEEAFGQKLVSSLKFNNNSEIELAEKAFNIIFGKDEIPEYLAYLQPWILKIRKNARFTYQRRINLLKLLSLFLLSKNQLKRILSPKNRFGVFKKHITDEEIIQNPYVLFEEYTNEEINLDDQNATDLPIGLFKIDIGMFPDSRYLEEDPSLQNLSPNGPERLRAVIIDFLNRNGKEGHCYASLNDIVNDINNNPLFYKDEININSEELTANNGLYYEHFAKRLNIIDSKFFYLNEVFGAEKLVKETVQTLVKRQDYPTTIQDYKEFVSQESEKLEKEIPNFGRTQFINERTHLFGNVLKKSFFIISGKPGTGKTKVLQKINDEINAQKESVTLLAPTGKASLRLANVTGDRNAQTIDRFIFDNKYNDCLDDFENLVSNKKRSKPIINNLIIDESSMVDLQHFSILLKMTELDSNLFKRLILVGDENQLPPIGLGRPFYDIIEFIKSIPEYRNNNLVELNTNCRQKFDSNITKVAQVFMGKNRYYDSILNEIEKECKISDGFVIKLWNSEDELLQKLESCMREMIINELKENGIHIPPTNPEQMNALFGLDFKGNVVGNFKESLKLDRFQILSPYRGDYFGTLGINQFIRERYREIKTDTRIKRSTFVKSDKIIRANNWYGWNPITRTKTLKLSNGSIGVIGWNTIYYFPDADHSIDHIDDWDNFELAYAITIHKSQGSEFKNVFLIIPNRLALLSKELLYTAFTRSTNHITIFLQSPRGEKSVLEQAINTSYTLVRNTSIFNKPLDFKSKIQPAKGVFVKSKIEYIIYDALEESGIDFGYEKELRLSDKNYVMRPDFTLHIGAATYFWEHLGILDTRDYFNKWQERKKDYVDNDKFDYLITTDDLNGVEKAKIMEVISDIKTGNIQTTPDNKFSKHHYTLY